MINWYPTLTYPKTNKMVISASTKNIGDKQSLGIYLFLFSLFLTFFFLVLLSSFYQAICFVIHSCCSQAFSCNVLSINNWFFVVLNFTWYPLCFSDSNLLLSVWLYGSLLRIPANIFHLRGKKFIDLELVAWFFFFLSFMISTVRSVVIWSVSH